jgi:hypothetical protein
LFIAIVGGCCGLLDSAAALEAVVSWSAWLMAVVGGCCPLVTDPVDVGPEPASFVANTLLKLSISLVHCPASATPILSANMADVVRMIVCALMASSNTVEFEARALRARLPVPMCARSNGTTPEVSSRSVRESVVQDEFPSGFPVTEISWRLRGAS